MTSKTNIKMYIQNYTASTTTVVRSKAEPGVAGFSENILRWTASVIVCQKCR